MAPKKAQVIGELQTLLKQMVHLDIEEFQKIMVEENLDHMDQALSIMLDRVRRLENNLT